METTQISVGGFEEGVSAKELTEYIEENVGLVCRCRLKTSCTPQYACPKFTKTTNNNNDICNYNDLVRNRNISKVPPHAFIQFAVPGAVKQAVKLSERGRLIFRGCALKVKDIIEFFVQHMVNDKLGVICNAHVVHADLSEIGALDERCLELAKLAAMAVDFPKTGKVAVLPPHLKPKIYPDFMDKADFDGYKSEKVLGVLYRRIKDMFGEEVEKWKSNAECENIFEALPYDKDLETRGFEEYLEEAWNYKCSYDQQLRALLGQFNVKREGEVVTGRISSLSKLNSRKQGDIKERLQHAYRALRNEFRVIFQGKTDGDTPEPCKRSEYEAKASAWYHVTYHPTWVRKAMELTEPDGDFTAPLLSFPWIAVDYLAQIKLQKLCPNVDYSLRVKSFTTVLFGKA